MATPTSICERNVVFALYSANETANELCSVLEAMFLHEMKPSFSAKVSSSLALLDVRRKNSLNVSTKTFWPLLVACSPKDVVNQLSRLANITTEIGQCRAWIRMALNEGLMENYVEAMLFDRSLISSMYKEMAFLQDPELTFTTKSLLQGLAVLNFKLTYDSHDLNAWPSDTLQLAGIQEVPRPTVPPIVEQSGTSTYDPMASFSTLGTALKSKEANEQQPASRYQSHTQKYKSKEGQRKRGKTTNVVPPDIIEQKDELKERRSHSMLATSLTKNEDNESSEGEEAIKGAPEHEDRDAEHPVFPEEIIHQTTVPIPIPSTEQSPNEPQLCHPKARSGTDPTDVPLSARRHGDDLHVPPHLDTSGTSVVGTPADSFGFLLKKHRRWYSQPTGGMVKRNSQPTLLEDFAGLSYDMVTPSQPTPSAGTVDEQPAADTHNAKQLGYEVIDSRASLSPPPTPPSGESCQTLLTHISREQGLDSQSFQCNDCSAPIGMIFGHAKVCTFDARYYCKECHCDEEVLIPARIIHNWDFNKHKVCHTNKEYLDSIEEEPLFNLGKINSSLYGHVPELQEVKMLRRQLCALVPYVYTCQTKVWDELGKKVWGKEYLFENEDLYSVADFVQVQSHHLMVYLKKTVSSAMKHVNRCKVCCQKGFICEICNNPKIIYPFEVHSTLQCLACQSVFHKSCKLIAECPKCARLSKRRQRRQQEEVVDEPPSPPKLAGDQ